MLTRWAAACEMATREAEQAELLLLEADPDPRRALEHVTRARETSWRTYRALLDAGAEPAGDAGLPTASDADPLRALATLSTPSSADLLSLLRATVAVAELVDAERGNVLAPDVPLLPGESRGTGWAETLSNLAERLRVEVEGPRRSRGRE